MIGILALQGCVEPHQAKLTALGVDHRLVRSRDDLKNLDGLILPGGESTTMIKLLRLFGMWEDLQAFAKPMWGICAGSILMASSVTNPQQEALAVIPLQVERNGYGRQLESFVAKIEFNQQIQDAVFIRAPRFIAAEAKILAEYRGEPVALQFGNKLVTAFHPEMAEGVAVHRYFVEELCQENVLSPVQYLPTAGSNRSQATK